MDAQIPNVDFIPGMSSEFNSFIRMMRFWMRDHPHLNRLIKGYESSNRLIAWAIVDFVSDFSATPPNLGRFTLEQLLDLGLSSFARRGSAIALMESVGFLQTRNNLTFSDGGMNVAISDKTPMLLQWLDRFQSKYEQDKKSIKISMNISQLFGVTGAHSEYFLTNGFYSALF
jgi:hypothetical protein